MASDLQIRDIDVVFADFVCSRESGSRDILRKAAISASSAVGHGDICVHLADLFGGADAASAAEALRGAQSVGRPGDYCPLILDEHGRLYLYRYWKYESDLAGTLTSMASGLPVVDEELLRAGLDRLFGQPGEDTDWQRVAAAAAIRGRFCVISGGPGTGKTTTVVKIIALLLEQAKGRRMRVGLAAPTGKAAARLKASIRNAGIDLAGLTGVAGEIPSEVSTIHRLLGVIPDSCRFRHNADNPLPYETVIVDEASMVPLGMMAKLVAALAPGTRLILLGDRDQLASVEAGAVLGDICGSGEQEQFSPEFGRLLSRLGAGLVPVIPPDRNPPPLADSLVVLKRNYRFPNESGIGTVATAINSGNGGEAFGALKSDSFPDSVWHDLPNPARLEKALAPKVVEGYRSFLSAEGAEEAMRCFDAFRILSPLRQGPYGVTDINALCEEILAAHRLIDPRNRWYRGRPVLVTANDYNLKLFNGDIGIVFPDPAAGGSLKVHFPLPEGGVRAVSPQRLPEHETAYAMTIHKSQGSEFETVLMVLPPAGGDLLTRELIYTGITRARKGVEIWGDEETFIAAAGRRTDRKSGLREALWLSERPA